VTHPLQRGFSAIAELLVYFIPTSRVVCAHVSPLSLLCLWGIYYLRVLLKFIRRTKVEAIGHRPRACDYILMTIAVISQGRSRLRLNKQDVIKIHTAKLLLPH